VKGWVVTVVLVWELEDWWVVVRDGIGWWRGRRVGEFRGWEGRRGWED
jgi:hypothetical protein